VTLLCDKQPVPSLGLRDRLRGPDAWLVVASLLFGAVSLSYPLGRDQGLFHYVGREWFAHGSLPYRDLVEHKTPGIFVIHGLLYLLFGDRQWPIRVVDLGFVCALGAFAAQVVRPRDDRRIPGLTGVCCLTTSVMHYGYMNFWDSAQLEVVYTTLTFASLALALRGTNPLKTDLGAGLLVGLALIVKPPSIWFCLVTFGVVVHRSWQEGDRERRVPRTLARAARFGVAAAFPAAVAVAYFAARGAAGEFALWILKVNAYYVSHASGPLSVRILYGRSRGIADWFQPMAPVVTAYFVLLAGWAWKTRDATMLRRCGLTAALAVAAYFSVAMQLKFYRYHTDVFAGPIAAAVGCLYLFFVERRELAAASPAASPATRPGLAGLAAPSRLAALFAGAILFTYASGPRVDLWLDAATRSIAYWSGSMSRDEFASTFNVPELAYDYAASERVGNWVREHSSPDDSVAVRGFEPQIYAVAERRYTGRFFWTNFITDDQRNLFKDQWRAEELGVLARTPPRFVVTVAFAGDIDRPEFFEKLGYERRMTDNAFAVYERPTSPAPPTPAP
jgi:hypothetical protein